MRTTLVIFALFVIALPGNSQKQFLANQLQNDSISVVVSSVNQADSILENFQSRADSIDKLAQNEFTKLEMLRSDAQKKLDSLSKLQLPTNKITHKLDSIEAAWQSKVEFYKNKLESLKSDATAKLKLLQLPPELQKPLTELQNSIQHYSLPGLDISVSDKLKTLKLLDANDLKLQSLSQRLELGDEWKNYTGKLNEVNKLAGQAGKYANEAGKVVNGNLSEVKSLDKTLEGKVSGMEGVGQLAEGQQFISDANSMLGDSTAMLNMAKEQLLNAAQDHFAGKEVILQEAMDKMAKLKTRLSEVQSMADLPKRLPNPLKGKPFIERLVPGISFQIQTSSYFLLDLNPMLLYKISPRILAGVGWNERIPFEELSIKKEQRIYGPRAAVEVNWTKGIRFKLSPELMNTTIPAYAATVRGITDPAYREWVPGLFIGMKKDFKVFKYLNGNSEMLYNLVDPHDSSPYADRFSIRFGFEFSMKKRTKR